MANETQSNEKLPPHSTIAEQAVLGALLLVADDYPLEATKMLAKVRRSDFYDLRHQTTYEAMCCLDLDKQPFQLTALQQWLTDKQKLPDAGGLPYLAQLPDNTPTSHSFERDLEILRDKAGRRALIGLATQAAQWARDESLDGKALTQQFADLAERVLSSNKSRQSWIQFYKPSECRNYIPPPGHVLVGDCHIVRGAVTVIGGPPGIGKSRSAHGLAIAGATGAEWFGLKIDNRFKTLILQNENGRFRLSKEFSEIHGDGLDEHIRVSEPPACGMAFDKPEFRAALAQYVADFKPDVVIIDPWNRRNGLFKPCPDFNWKNFDGHNEKRNTLSLADIEALFDGGKLQLTRKGAVKKLMETTDLKETACYEALKADGRFKDHLSAEENGLLTWKP